MHRLGVALTVTLLGLAGCGPGGAEQARDDGEQVLLGPADGHDLSAVDLDRVGVGDVAPDFTLMSLAGDPVRLSSFRGSQNVVLVFYRGHW